MRTLCSRPLCLGVGHLKPPSVARYDVMLPAPSLLALLALLPLLPLLPSHFSADGPDGLQLLSPHSLRFSPCGWPARPLSPSLHNGSGSGCSPSPSPALLQDRAGLGLHLLDTCIPRFLPAQVTPAQLTIQLWAGWAASAVGCGESTARLCNDKKPRHPPSSGKLQARCELLPSISLEPGELHAHVPPESWGLK
jgi:hypothetical protein